MLNFHDINGRAGTRNRDSWICSQTSCRPVGLSKAKTFGFSVFPKDPLFRIIDQQNDLCAQQRLRSAWASAQSDQSLRCPPEGSFGPQLPIEHTAKTLIRGSHAQADLNLRWAHRSFCWFCHEAGYVKITTVAAILYITVTNVKNPN